MKIELGKRYINANGELIIITSKQNDSTYPFIDEDEKTYTKEGLEFKYKNNQNDLICEVIPSIYNIYINEKINLKQFIELHIEYYEREIKKEELNNLEKVWLLYK